VTWTFSSRPEVPLDQVAAVLALLDRVPGSLIGFYLYGSSVDGGLRSDSDLDLFGVIDRRLDRDERRTLVDRLLPLSGRDTRPADWRPIDLTLVVRGEVVPWRYPPRFDFQFGEWLRPDFLAGDLEPWPAANPDVAVLIAMVLGRSETLVGPPPRDLLARVPRADLLRAMTDELESLLGDVDTDTRNVLLTLARMWMTASTGEVQSKDLAATWAAERLSEERRPLLLRARSGYLGEIEDRWDDLAAARSLAHELGRRLGQEANLIGR
jgi:predicted nucleotidyltransferase